MGKLICTSECEKCKNARIDETDKAKIKVYCEIKGKTYYWGQYVLCESK